MPSTPNQLFLIDAHALCYRSFYAIRDLTNSRGQMTNAVYGFVTTMRKISRVYEPAYMAVCFDSPAKTRRQEKYAQYKIQRPPMPEGLISQISLIKDVVRAYHFPIFEVDGYEADDIIATLANTCGGENLECVIVSEDKDLYQLANPSVHFYSTRSDKILKLADLEKKLGFNPKYMSDYLSLTGDKVDNIPGVRGIGKVGATRLIQDYGGLDAILARIDEIEPVKVRQKLLDDREQAVLSKDLAVLEYGVPIDCDLARLKVQDPDCAELHRLFKEFEFRRLAEEYRPVSVRQSQVEATPPFQTLESESQCRSFIDGIPADSPVALLLQTGHEEEGRPEGIYLMTSELAFVPAGNIAFLESLFLNTERLKVVYNYKEWLHAMSRRGVSFSGPVFDLLLAGYLLSPARGSYVLEELILEHRQVACEDSQNKALLARYMLEIYPPIAAKLEELSLLELYKNLELPLSEVLFTMEHQGVKIDLPLLQDLSQRCSESLARFTADLYEQAGGEFNINSPKQLGVILFERLGLPVIKRTKTGFSTDESVLSILALSHAVPALILDYRQVAKLKSTYIDALPKLVNTRTGRLHASFDQTGTETGRLSSRNPNLQNIPIRTDLGREIRKAVIPSEDGWELIAADYSQIELRILAHLTKDPNLLKAFQSNQDIHAYTASLIFDVPEASVDRHMRDTAKRVNFGIIYGMSSFGLGKDLRIPQKQAQEFINKYFLRYPAVQAFMDECVHFCEEHGYVRTLLKRRRYLPEIKSSNNAIRQFAQRQAVNTPVQGSAADMMKVAMIDIQREIRKQSLKARLLITVHDELVLEAPTGERESIASLINDKMVEAMALSVPVIVTMKVGPNWLDMKEINVTERMLNA